MPSNHTASACLGQEVIDRNCLTIYHAFCRQSNSLVHTNLSLLSQILKTLDRPPNVVVGEHMFYRDSSSSIFFLLVSYSQSSLNGTQPKPVTCAKMSVIWKCMFEIWDIPSHQKSEAHIFRRLRNLTTNLTAYIFGTKHDIDNRENAFRTIRGLLHCRKMP